MEGTLIDNAVAPVDAAQTHSDTPPTLTVAGQRLTVFVEGRPLFARMLEDIAAAKARIWLEVYTFFNDDSGRAVAQALKQKAGEGLDVRVLFDALGSQGSGGAFFADMRGAGVRVHTYHGFWEALRRRSVVQMMNRRDHRKILVVDDHIAYFGGMNIIDTESVDAARQAMPSGGSSASWRDVHVRLDGPQQADVAESFDRSWRRAHGETVPRRTRAYRRALLAPHEESIRFFDSGPGLKNSRAARVYTRLIRHANRSLTMSMAYFIPVGRVLRSIVAAGNRGVRIRIVVPGQSDIALAQYASYYLYSKLTKRGIRIYEREKRMLHSKVMVVDGQWTVVGSCNMDPRSLWINLEFMAVIRSRAFARVIENICAFEMRQSRIVRGKECARPPVMQRMRNAAAWGLRWWL